MDEVLKEQIRQQLMDVRPEQLAGVYRVVEKAIQQEREKADEVLRQFADEAHMLYVRLANATMTPEKLQQMLREGTDGR